MKIKLAHNYVNIYKAKKAAVRTCKAVKHEALIHTATRSAFSAENISFSSKQVVDLRVDTETNVEEDVSVTAEVYDGQQLSYGGSQLCFDGMLKKSGCGVIAAGDTLLYLKHKHRHHPSNNSSYRGCDSLTGSSPRMHHDILMDQASYMHYIRRIAPAFPIIPGRGMPGFMLSLYLNFYMLIKHMPYSTAWGFFSLRYMSDPNKLLRHVESMLSHDIPVILGIGPGIHQCFRPRLKRGIMLYTYSKETGAFTPVQRIRSHFVVITGISGDHIRLSSWGRVYYISAAELCRYSRLDLFGFFTNAVCIRPR